LVAEPHVARSRSREVTFERDLVDVVEIRGHVERLASGVTAEVAAGGRVVTHVSVKVRTSTFFTRTKTGKLAAPTTDPAIVATRALEVLDRFELDRPVRLLGARVLLELPSPPPGRET
jgi:DNA polymerase-4